MKCYNCDHLIIEETTDCFNCHFPVDDSILLMKAAKEARKEIKREYDHPISSAQVIRKEKWYEKAFDAITHSPKVVQLNY